MCREEAPDKYEAGVVGAGVQAARLRCAALLYRLVSGSAMGVDIPGLALRNRYSTRSSDPAAAVRLCAACGLPCSPVGTTGSRLET